MALLRLPLLVAAVLAAPLIAAHAEHPNIARHNRIRQASSSSASSAAPAGATPGPPLQVTGTASGFGTVPSSIISLTASDSAIPPLSMLTSGAPTTRTTPLTATFSPGQAPPFSGAPPLPTTTYDKNKYPIPTSLAPTDTPEVQEWLKELDGVEIPDIPPTVDDAICSSNAQAAADHTRCWWTCGGCTRPSDIFTCPTKMDWGVSFDDGPSPYTPQVLDFLKQNNLDATFFVVGSSAYWRPEILQDEYMLGHQISVHTWFHPHLTTLSNIQIVAELGYTREIIKDIIGVTPKTFRPPYGDIDDRVRAIALAMNLQPIIWTRDPQTLAQFDTNDWRIPAGDVTGLQAFAQFQNILQNASTDLQTGFIVLEHDLYPETVDLATGYTIPAAMSHQPPFSLKSINQCLGVGLADVYAETASNKTLIALSTNWTGNFLNGLSSDGNTSADGSAPAPSGSSGSKQGGGNSGNGAGRVGASLAVVLGAALVSLW